MKSSCGTLCNFSRYDWLGCENCTIKYHKDKGQKTRRAKCYRVSKEMKYFSLKRTKVKSSSFQDSNLQSLYPN